ncbi:MAG TPA: putative lipid II flippase FtsW, partial [Nitrospirota bacterium]|nr:putative lipid II flippase FtsW [Nitrospirota bacterium]
MLFEKLKEDRLIFIITFTLLAFGLVMVYSASSVMAMKKFGDSAYFLKRQALWALLGVVAMAAAWKVDYKKFRMLSLPLLGIVFVLLILALVGPEINGARRWIRLGGFSFQPSELTKPALVVFVAASLAKRMDRLQDFWYGLGPYLILTGTMVFLIALEPDLGTAAAISAAVMVMLFVAGARPAHLGALALAALPLLYVQLFRVGFRRNRLAAFMDPWSDPLGTGFQAIQSFLAFGGGGLSGLGLGESRQKLLFLPEPHNDFIYSVIGEEFGLIGAMAVALMFAAFVLLGLRLALRCRDNFGKFLAFGLTLTIGMQALVNMGVATGLFPNKGMPLPFVSYGGSS